MKHIVFNNINLISKLFYKAWYFNRKSVIMKYLKHKNYMLNIESIDGMLHICIYDPVRDDKILSTSTYRSMSYAILSLIEDISDFENMRNSKELAIWLNIYETKCKVA